ncbi:hypothetical protein N9X11_04145, partial [Candidatus Pelagibacter bacterium]|nr:hypothetical protein [Candidatus Pelagibacter bacterium]
EKKNKDALENIYLDKLKNKENVTLQLSPGMFLDYSDQQNNNFLPLSGISNTQTLMCNESKNLIQYQTDRYGFNNNNAIWDEKIIDILLIGDSYTHGLCVNNEFNIKGNLELLGSEINKNLKIMNLGMQGSGPLIELAIMKEFSKNRKIKNLVWFYYEGNDLTDLDAEISNENLQRYINPKFTQNLQNRQSESDLFLKEYLKSRIDNHLTKKKITLKSIFDKFRYHLKFTKLRLEFSEIFNFKFTNAAPKLKNESFENFEKIIKITQKYLSDEKIKFHLVYLPSYYRYKTGDNQLHHYSEVIDIIKQNEINLIDMHKELFVKIDDQLSLFPFRKFGHYTPEGYKLISEIILRKISLDAK